MFLFRKSRLQVVGVLFGSQRHVIDERKQEVNLRLYLGKPIHKIPDFIQVSFNFSFPFKHNRNFFIEFLPALLDQSQSYCLSFIGDKLTPKV